MFNLKSLNIINKDNQQFNLDNKKIIGLYFSASWCPPCRKFTPVISTLYEDMIEYYDDIEFVFISSDKSNIEFNEYWDKMSFPALSYEYRDKKEELVKLYDIGPSPALIFIDTNGELITKDGKKIIEDSNGNIEYLRSQLNM
jgi:nucleoredoxin